MQSRVSYANVGQAIKYAESITLIPNWNVTNRVACTIVLETELTTDFLTIVNNIISVLGLPKIKSKILHVWKLDNNRTVTIFKSNKMLELTLVNRTPT